MQSLQHYGHEHSSVKACRGPPPPPPPNHTSNCFCMHAPWTHVGRPVPAEPSPGRGHARCMHARMLTGVPVIERGPVDVAVRRARQHGRQVVAAVRAARAGGRPDVVRAGTPRHGLKDELRGLARVRGLAGRVGGLHKGVVALTAAHAQQRRAHGRGRGGSEAGLCASCGEAARGGERACMCIHWLSPAHLSRYVSVGAHLLADSTLRK